MTFESTPTDASIADIRAHMSTEDLIRPLAASLRALQPQQLVEALLAVCDELGRRSPHAAIDDHLTRIRLEADDLGTLLAFVRTPATGAQ